MTATALRFTATESRGEVGALLCRPPEARALLLLAHGAGAGMQHAFMEALAGGLAGEGVATLRYQFLYMEAGRRRPDPQPVLRKTVRSAVAEARAVAGGLPLFAGGKSMGGRMTSLAAAAEPLGDVHGLVFFGFPLHPAGKPGVERAAHLRDVTLPTCFLQGTRDKLADLDLLRPVLEDLDGATLHVVEGADHGFHVLKRSGRTDEEVLRELARVAASWMAERA